MPKKKPQFDVLSPDGFSIQREGYFNSREEAQAQAQEWVKRYEGQGYYSSTKFGRIHLDDLLDYCELVEVK